ncbi:MAG: xanthine dehydrogenase family protein subunit M [Bacteroidia bacterium]|nr:xanthine dehydrogenase family protein subunit M [Bacteroidia bacterium]
MYISDFNYLRPRHLQEAIDILDKSPDGILLAGGTDLLVEIKKGLRKPKEIISLTQVKELKEITSDNNNLYIGAGATHNEIINSQIVNKFYPVIALACSKIGSEQVRNSATIGGNLCTGASCCDSAPVLIAVGASVEVHNATDVKTIPLKDFFVFNKLTVLKKNEIVTRVIVPLPKSGTGTHYEKLGLREAASISVVSVAVKIESDGVKCINASVIIGAVAPTPRISEKATNAITGKNIKDILNNTEILEQAGQGASDDSIPISDIRGGAQYRRDILKVLTKRAIIQAIQSITK